MVLLDILHKIYEISADRLRYAESKNGALLAVNALIFFRIMDKQISLPVALEIPYFASILFFSASILICIFSFIARLDIPRVMKKNSILYAKSKPNFDNLLSSLKMAHYVPKAYANKLAKKMQQEDYSASELDIDYAEHIIVNAKVIVFKFNCFRWATLCMLGGMICTIIIKVSSVG